MKKSVYKFSKTVVPETSLSWNIFMLKETKKIVYRNRGKNKQEYLKLLAIDKEKQV